MIVSSCLVDVSLLSCHCLGVISSTLININLIHFLLCFFIHCNLFLSGCFLLLFPFVSYLHSVGFTGGIVDDWNYYRS